MIEYKEISIDKLTQLLDNISEKGTKVVAPQDKNGKYFFGDAAKGYKLPENYIQTVLSPKSVIFPRNEILFDYKFKEKDIIIEDNTEFDDVVVFGLRPCDVKAMNYLADFFIRDYTDKQVKLRWEKTTLISVSCESSDEYCYCTSVGGDPSDSTGSDLHLTKISGDKYFAEAVSNKGKEILTQYKELFSETEKIDKTNFTADVPVRFDLNKVMNNIPESYNEKFWEELALACHGCGTCAFSCPSCTCFDIQDEADLNGGSRVRTWDCCAFGLFTVHASGHNPREVQSQRWKHRVNHKFRYSVTNHDTVSCYGCGRCIRNCPSGMSILQPLELIAEMK